MKPFEFFLENIDVRKVQKNVPLARSLIKDMYGRIKASLALPIGFSKMAFENFYDALRDFCDSLLAKDGFKSYSHEASIAYLLKYNFSFAEISKLDKFREMRNGSKYYGREISDEDVNEIKNYYNSIKDKINKLIKEFDFD